MKAIRTYLNLRSIEGLFNNIIAFILLVGMMLLVVSDVAGRYLFNRPVPGTIEITEFIMVAIVYFTISYTQAIKSHIKVELLIVLMSRRKRLVLELITYIFGLVIFALMTWQGVMLFFDSWEILEETDGLIPFPIYPAKATIPIGCFVLSLRFIVDIIDVLKDLRRKEAP